MTRRFARKFAYVYAAITIVLTVLLLTLEVRSAEQAGLRRLVFSGVEFADLPLLDDISSDVTLGFLEADPTLPRRFFSARWHGFWYLPEASVLELHGAGDDRLDVWIDEKLVIRRTPPADMHTQVRNVALAAGVHEIRVEYAQHGGAYNLRVEWAPAAGRPRPLPGAMLFPQRPDDGELQLARQTAVLRSVVPVLWLFPLGIALVLLARPLASRISARSAYDWYRTRRTNVAFACVVGSISLSAVIARLPGWNPESLWDDDVIFGSLIRSSDLYSLITTPIHHAPGLFLVWRWVLRDLS